MELEGRRRWLGLLAATLALPGCVSMGPRPEPRQALPADWYNRGEVAARTGGAAALVDGLRGRGAGCAGRTRAGGQPDAGPGGATAQGGARPVAFQRGPGLAADRPARRRPAPAQVVWSARRERAVRRRSRAGRISRWRRKNGPSAITRPVSTPAGNSTCSAASPPPRTRRARAPAPPKPTCARPGCRWPPRPCAPISNCARAAAPSGAVRPAGRPAPSARPGAGAQARRHRQRFRCGPRQRAGSRNGRPAAAVGATGAAARAASGGAYRREPDRARAAGVSRPAPAARRADRAAAGRCRARPDIRRAEQQVRRPRPNCGCRSPSYTRA